MTRATCAICPRSWTTQADLRVGEVPGLEHAKVLATQSRELVEQRIERAFRVPRAVAEPIIRLEARLWALREDDAGAGHPVGFLAIDQMADVVEGTERI